MKKVIWSKKLLVLLHRKNLQGELLKFPGKVKPVHEGWYYGIYKEGYKGFYRFFDGSWWLDQSTAPNVVELIPADKPTYWYALRA